MKILWILLISVASLTACSAIRPEGKASSSEQHPKNPAVAVKTNRVLILSTRYYDPSLDTVGINKMTEDVTQAFSAELQPLLRAAGKTPINVNDKSRQHTAGERLALHSVENNAEGVVLLEMDTPLSNGEYAIHLKVRYFDLRYVIRDGATSSVIPTNSIERSYLLSGPGADPNLSWETVARRFMEDLKTSGRIK